MQKRSNEISGPLQQSPWATELSEDEACWKEEKKTRESYILIHKLAFGTPDSEDQKRPPVALLGYFFIYSMQFWTESSLRHCSEMEGWARASHTFSSIGRVPACMALQSSEKENTCASQQNSHASATPWHFFISDSYFPGDRCTQRHILGEQTA